MASIAFASLQKILDLAKGVDSSADMDLRIVSSSRLAVGVDPFHPTHIIDLARESVVACNGVEAHSSVPLKAPSKVPAHSAAQNDAKAPG